MPEEITHSIDAQDLTSLRTSTTASSDFRLENELIPKFRITYESFLFLTKNYNYYIKKIFKEEWKLLITQDTCKQEIRITTSSGTTLEKESILGACFVMPNESRIFVSATISLVELKDMNR